MFCLRWNIFYIKFVNGSWNNIKIIQHYYIFIFEPILESVCCSRKIPNFYNQTLNISRFYYYQHYICRSMFDEFIEYFLSESKSDSMYVSATIYYKYRYIYVQFIFLMFFSSNLLLRLEYSIYVTSREFNVFFLLNFCWKIVKPNYLLWHIFTMLEIISVNQHCVFNIFTNHMWPLSTNHEKKLPLWKKSVHIIVLYLNIE